MIRYNTEDIGIITEETCECGCRMKKLFLFGRESDQICLEKGGKFPPLVLENVLPKK